SRPHNPTIARLSTSRRSLQKHLVRRGSGGLVFGAAQHDPGIGFPRNVYHHVAVLILRALGAIALGIGICRDVKNILLQDLADVAMDIVAKTWVDLVQHVAAVVERPHLADGLVARSS